MIGRLAGDCTLDMQQAVLVYKKQKYSGINDPYSKSILLFLITNMVQFP